jgi:uncharacterized RDD family membrane protein YckC
MSDSVDQPGYAGGPTAQSGQPAGLLERFLARLIDSVLLAIVNVVVVTFIVVGTVMGTDAGAMAGFGGGDGGYAAGAVSSLLTTALALGYFTYLEATRGQTAGKMLMKLHTRGPDGKNPTMEQALKRNAFLAIGVLGVIPFLGTVAGLLSLAAVIAIAVTISNNTETRQGWHDNFAGGTRVVKLG